jgi:ABC-type branched-subunit amino acid transport system permease subunit
MGLVFIAVVIWAPGGVMGIINRLSRTDRKGEKA